MTAPKNKRLLLIGWDSADWKIMHPLIDQGMLPGLAQLVESGVSGNITTLEPQLSPMLWTSIATGKHAYHHGVHGFTEVDPLSGRIVPVSAATRQCKTVWEMLNERGLRTHVVSWFATQGERDLNGKMVSNMFGHLKGVAAGQDPATWPPPMPGTYWPEDLGESMNHLRVSPWELDGNAVLRMFIPDAPTIDQQHDPNLWNLAEKLAEAYSVHSAATYLMESDPQWDFMAVYYRAIDEISHFFMPYHPPQMVGIPDRDFELYKEVVTGCYRAHDMMLQRLLQLAGPDTAVVLVSDHGFHSDHLRPKFTPSIPAGITVWHRPQGAFVASGPGFKQDDLIYGARLLDLTPTVLTYFSLPVGEDMEGRVLAEAFATPPAITTIPSWETGGGATKPHGSLSAAQSQALLEQFVALGYIDPVSDNLDEAAAETLRENRWNLARACMDGGRDEQALLLLEDIYAAYPERTDYAQQLARCQRQLGLLDEANETIAATLESLGQTETAFLLKASIEFEKGEFTAALESLAVVREMNPEDLQLQLLLSRTYLELRHWDAAETAARKVLAADPHNPQAYLTLARLQLHQDNASAAVESALEAIGYQFGNPRGHFLLGSALVRLGDWASAATALRNHLQLNPASSAGFRLLGRVYRALGEHGPALDCEQKSRLTSYKQLADARHLNAATLGLEARQRAAVRCTERELKRDALAQRTAADAAVEPMEFVIVSGLPRSGTSLMMQMLRAGGMELMTDGARVANEDNPEGYWEWEEIKKLGKNPRLIEQAGDKVIKIISALLPHLPITHRYRVIFMTRPVEQVVASQWKMLERSGRQPKSERAHLIETQRNHARGMLESLRRSDLVEVLEIDYPDLVADPQAGMRAVAAFLPGRFHACPAVLATVKPALHRNRSCAGVTGAD